MQEGIKAIYEDGVIKPLKKLNLKEHEQVTITIEKNVTETKPKRTAMSIVGIFESGIGDLSNEHDNYLYGWKKRK
ncbi:MAG: antitoxin family protein [Nitrospira sp.]|nr:antitoxin family protein [Nitrospira sp.]